MLLGVMATYSYMAVFNCRCAVLILAATARPYESWFANSLKNNRAVWFFLGNLKTIKVKMLGDKLLGLFKTDQLFVERPTLRHHDPVKWQRGVKVCLLYTSPSPRDS